jgi:hypothetical protein
MYDDTKEFVIMLCLIFCCHLRKLFKYFLCFNFRDPISLYHFV